MNNVSGHSGWPEDVELRALEEKAERVATKKQARFTAMLELMNSLGIAPRERRTFIIGFAKWLEQEENNGRKG